MTEKAVENKKRPSFSVVSLGVFTVFLFILFLKNSTVASFYVQKGISICTSTLIPSLFPYLVLSDILLSLSLPSLFERPLRKIMRSLFGVSGAGACAFILGVLCGFPLGAKCAVELYDKGEISKNECERLLAFCNIPSLAFTSGVVGNSIFQSVKLGFYFWLITVFSAIICGILNKFFYKSKEYINIPETNKNTYKKAESSETLFVRAIERSARSTLLICAYVIFFSALVGCISFLLKEIAIPDALKCFIFGFFELTNGISNTAALPTIHTKAIFCAFFVGWSGLSVHLQIFSISDGRGLKFTSYMLSKFFQGALCALISGLVFY